MFIKKLTIKNFKNFESASFDFGDENVIKGKNGSGKSSIRDAILFVLYNKTLDGSRDTDRYIKKGKDFCEVELETSEHTYVRKRSRSNSEFKIDGEDASLTEGMNTIPFEVFSSVFNVGYFMSLDEKEQRQLLLQNTLPVNRFDLFKKLGGKTMLLEKVKTLDNLIEVIKAFGTKKLQKSKDKEKYSVILEYLKAFPITELGKVSLIIIKKVKDVVDKEIVRVTKLLNINNILLSDLEYNYKILANLPIEEMKMKVKDLESRLKTQFENVEIILTELYKSEIGYKEVFKFKINGIEYKNLSSGEKVRFNLVISEFFNSLLANPINCYFVDDTALLDEDIKTLRQSFITNIWPHDIDVKVVK